MHRKYTQAQLARTRLQAEVEGWKARYLDAEKRLEAEEAKTKELREENGRGRKALSSVRIAAGVSYRLRVKETPCTDMVVAREQEDASKAGKGSSTTRKDIKRPFLDNKTSGNATA